MAFTTLIHVSYCRMKVEGFGLNTLFNVINLSYQCILVSSLNLFELASYLFEVPYLFRMPYLFGVSYLFAVPYLFGVPYLLYVKSMVF